MKHRKTLAAIAAMGASLTCLAGGAFASNIVVNGDFEGGSYTAGQPAGDSVPNGWLLGPPSYSINSNINVLSAVNGSIDQGPESGGDYIGFHSPETDGSRDCLYQQLTTVAGQTYTISFWVASTASSVGNNVGLDVEWDENTSNQTALDNPTYTTPTNTGPLAYTEYTFTETASTNDTRIDFHSVDTNGLIELDNVVVTAQSATPEPMTMLLTGSGLVLAGLLRKRRLS
jgi:hypothetical protein